MKTRSAPVASSKKRGRAKRADIEIASEAQEDNAEGAQKAAKRKRAAPRGKAAPAIIKKWLTGMVIGAQKLHSSDECYSSSSNGGFLAIGKTANVI